MIPLNFHESLPKINQPTFEHTEQHCDQIFLQIEKLLQQIDLARIPRKLFLHVSKQEQESTDCIPKSEKQK